MTSKWTPEEDSRFHELWSQDLPVEQIARDLGRTRRSVTNRRSRLDLKARPGVYNGPSALWTPEEDRALQESWEGGVQTKFIARQLNRSLDSVRNRTRRLKLPVRNKPSNEPTVDARYKIPESMKDLVLRRAYEAGITPSSYIRRCIWDAELKRIEWMGESKS